MKNGLLVLVSGVVLLSGCAATEPDGPNGAELYSANCQGCHGVEGVGANAPNIQGQTAAVIQTKIDTIQAMAPLQGKLTTAEIESIADYLGSVTPSAKGELSLYGEVDVAGALSGLLVVVDSDDNVVEVEVIDGEFMLPGAGLSFPLSLQFTAEGADQSVYALINADEELLISEDSDGAFREQFDEPAALFEN